MPFAWAVVLRCRTRDATEPTTSLNVCLRRAVEGEFANGLAHSLTCQCPPLSGPTRTRRPDSRNFLTVRLIALPDLPRQAASCGIVKPGSSFRSRSITAGIFPRHFPRRFLCVFPGVFPGVFTAAQAARSRSAPRIQSFGWPSTRSTKAFPTLHLLASSLCVCVYTVGLMAPPSRPCKGSSAKWSSA